MLCGKLLVIFSAHDKYLHITLYIVS